MTANLLTTKELIARLQISEPSIIRYRKKGKIPYIRVGNLIRYDWEQVIKALEKGSANA